MQAVTLIKRIIYQLSCSAIVERKRAIFQIKFFSQFLTSLAHYFERGGKTEK